MIQGLSKEPLQKIQEISQDPLGQIQDGGANLGDTGRRVADQFGSNTQEMLDDGMKKVKGLVEQSGIVPPVSELVGEVQAQKQQMQELFTILKGFEEKIASIHKDLEELKARPVPTPAVAQAPPVGNTTTTGRP